MALNGASRIATETWDEIITMIEAGNMLRPICAALGVLEKSVRRDINDYPAIAARYAEAKAAREDFHLDEMITIADSATPESVQVDKLRLHARDQWLARSNPARFGVKSTVVLEAKPLIVSAVVYDSMANPPGLPGRSIDAEYEDADAD